MKTILSLVLVACCAAASDYPYQAVSMRDAAVTGGFWLPRVLTNRDVTVAYDFQKCEDTGRIANITNAAARTWGNFVGTPWDDSDVYKVIEGACYVLGSSPDGARSAYLDALIAQIAGAQEPDGYLYTARTIGFRADMMGPTRWSACGSSHELYNAGHLYEAAVAHYEVTGKRTLLDVAIKNANLVERIFGTQDTQLRLVPGHEEIEIGLCKLYRATQDPRYLDLAKRFIDMRGRRDLRPLWGAQVQDHAPVTNQTEAVGHAVRAGYLYAGMADVAALTGDASYAAAIQTLWENVVGRKMHLNGGIGANPSGEKFGADYELPNENSYLETCAAIANALWNQRMFLLHGDAKYVDVLERIIYNGFLSGISLGGNEFFYPNPLASKGGYARSKWFGCSCCPVNVVRFIPQIVTYAYAHRDDALYWNLFIDSTANVPLRSGVVRVAQHTSYPWEGTSTLTFTAVTNAAPFDLKIRVPGWAIGRPVPSDLYTQVNPGSLADVAITVNGADVPLSLSNGYCTITRQWTAGDAVRISMSMPVRRIRAHARVAADVGRLAVECGPVVYSAEGVDNDGSVFNKVIAEDAAFTATTCDILGNVYPAYTCAATGVYARGGTNYTQNCTVKLVPNFAWCHRGAGEMQTWFPTRANLAEAQTDVQTTFSHVNTGSTDVDNITALYDGITPDNVQSGQTLRRMTFWNHVGTSEWIQYTYPEPTTIRRVGVYWFEDEAIGGKCRLPASWRVVYRATEDGEWLASPVSSYRFEKNRLTMLEFTTPVQAKQVRLEVQCQPDYSVGFYEWIVE